MTATNHMHSMLALNVSTAKGKIKGKEVLRISIQPTTDRKATSRTSHASVFSISPVEDVPQFLPISHDTSQGGARVE